MKRMADERIFIYKLPMEKITESGYSIENYTDEDAISSGEMVPVSNSQLIGKINDYYEENGMDGFAVKDAIVNIVVPSASGKQTNRVAEKYTELAHTGFNINGRHYIRLCTGSGQLRNNTVTFVWDLLYPYLTEAIYCGICPEDLGADFSVSKWNAYVGLSESGMHFLKEIPNVCIISDYEEVKPHLPIDYIETRYTKQKKKKCVDKDITRCYFDDPEMGFDPLNSFDGQGLADPEWVKKTAIELGYLRERSGYIPSEYIVRAPWCKGLVVSFDFKAYCREHGVTVITDVYGCRHDVDDIDLLLSTSQFKMWKVYKKYGGWPYYIESMKKHNLRWGVVIANKAHDDDYRSLNYQYIQALDLSDDDIDCLCRETEERLNGLCSGDVAAVYSTLIGKKGHDDNTDLYELAEDMRQRARSESILQQAIAHNYDLLQDDYILSLIYREAQAQFDAAKIGKILCRGGYSFIVSDPVAQIQHIIREHAEGEHENVQVTGLIPANSVYSEYWNKMTPVPDKIVLMRSPLIDPSEVTVCGLSNTPEMERWYSHIHSGLILSIFDLNTLALQNCDFDGDRCFSSNDAVLIKSAQREPVPILYPSAGAQLKGEITFDSIIAADVRGLNSAVGSLSNQATCLYALRAQYGKGTQEYEELSRRIKIISELVGVEIDKIKTGIPPAKPSAWVKEETPYEQIISLNGGKSIKVVACSPEEQDRIRRHNDLIPDNKPLFMRYIYPSLDRDLIKYDKAFDNECKYNLGTSLSELLGKDYDSLAEAEKRIVDRYYKYYPAINSPCSMNKICDRFERLQRKFASSKGVGNMLPNFVTDQQYNDAVMDAMESIVDLYQRQKRFITRTSKTNHAENNKQIAIDSRERYDILHQHIRGKVMELVEGDIQAAYNYLVRLCVEGKCTEAAVWSILGDAILAVIPQKTYREGV